MASDVLDNDEVGVEIKGQVVKVKSWLNAKGKLTLGKGAEKPRGGCQPPGKQDRDRRPPEALLGRYESAGLASS